MKKVYDSFQDWIYNQQIKNNGKTKCGTITFQVTDDCNLNCSYCYQINKSHHAMPFENAKNLIDIILKNDTKLKNYIDFDEFGGIIIEFIGGEPFLQIDLISQIMDYFIDQLQIYNHRWLNYFAISITSNGTLYFNPKVQEFIKKWYKHLSLCISIDGDKELHDTCRKFPTGEGSYDLAIAAMQHYHSNFNGRMQTKMTLSPENIQYTSKALINLLEIGYTDININCVFEKGWENKHAIILYDQLKEASDYILENNKDTDKYYISIYNDTLFHPMTNTIDIQNWCGSTGFMIAMDWKGDIYPCIRFMESALGEDAPPFKIGHLDQQYKEIACKSCIDCFHKIDRISQSTKECLECNVAQGCAWCTGYNYQDSGGDFNHRATYICCMHKARSLANAYFWNQYYRKYNEKRRFKIWLSDEEALKIVSQNELQMLKELQKPIE